MGQDRQKNTAQWFYETLFRPETIRPRAPEPGCKLPPPLMAARSLDLGAVDWQSRTLLFLKQARLLKGYEDDFVYDRPVTHYFPTYQSLSDPELRGYFGFSDGVAAWHKHTDIFIYGSRLGWNTVYGTCN